MGSQAESLLGLMEDGLCATAGIRGGRHQGPKTQDFCVRQGDDPGLEGGNPSKEKTTDKSKKTFETHNDSYREKKQSTNRGLKTLSSQIFSCSAHKGHGPYKKHREE
jgi:hypothetical protein